MEKCCVVLNGCRSASGVDFWQVLGALEKKVTETRGLIDLILKSAYRRGHHYSEGFIVPYAVWNQLWAWRDSERHPEKVVFDVLKKPKTIHEFGG